MQGEQAHVSSFPWMVWAPSSRSGEQAGGPPEAPQSENSGAEGPTVLSKP